MHYYVPNEKKELELKHVSVSFTTIKRFFSNDEKQVVPHLFILYWTFS